MSTKIKGPHESYTFLSISSSHLIFMRLSSFLPLMGKSFTHPLSLMLQLWSLLVVIAINMFWTGYGIRMIMRGDVEIDFICEEVIVLDFTARYILLVINRGQLCRLVESCEKLWSYLKVGENIYVRQFERKVYYFRNFVILNSLLASTAFDVTAYFTKLPPLEANDTERRILPARFFMDVQEQPAYVITFVSQVIADYYVDLLIAITGAVPLYFIMMACGYLRSLRNRLLSFKGGVYDTSEEGRAAFEFVIDCTQFHQQIMIFCDDIERMTRTLFLFANFCPIYNVSITGFVILNSNEDIFKFAPLLVYNFIQFFICQWAPDYLAEESEAIAKAAYFASLQPQAPSHRERINRILFFMMTRAQKPVQLTAGGLVNLSIRTFGAMTKSAFSFFMVLRN